MKIKLDENLPRSAAAILSDAGHDVDTVLDEDLGGADDPTVSRAATESGRLILTLDRGFGDIGRYPPGSHAGILVLRIDDHSRSAVADTIAELAQRVDLDGLAGCVAVYRDGALRVRRAGQD